MNVQSPFTSRQPNASSNQIVQDVVINSLNTAIVLLNHELEVLLINQAAESLLDLSAKRVEGQRLPAKIPGWRDIESLLYESLQTGQTLSLIHI